MAVFDITPVELTLIPLPAEKAGTVAVDEALPLFIVIVFEIAVKV